MTMNGEIENEDRAYVFDAVQVLVRGGFATEADILEDLEDTVAGLLERYDDALVAELRSYVQDQMRSERAAEETWPDVTTNDAITRAFDDLRVEWIVALENAGLTQSDGWSDAEEEAAVLLDDIQDELDAFEEELEDDEDVPQHRWAPVRGATFYHGQDLARAVHGQGLHLAFGAFAAPGRPRADVDADSVAVGRAVSAALERHGVPVEWDGTVGQRLFIPPFAWRRRRWTRPPAR